MKRVIVESPLGAVSREGIEKNKIYAKRCMWDSFKRGEAPFASHLLYAQELLLDDMDKQERELGIAAGFAWGEVADLVALYVDFGVSKGMFLGLNNAIFHAIPEIVVRSIKSGKQIVIHSPDELQEAVSEVTAGVVSIVAHELAQKHRRKRVP